MLNLLQNTSLRELKRKLSVKQVRTDLLQRHSFARDAGLYRLVPEVIIKALKVEDISALFQVANKHKRHIVFRAGGTSLSGQAISDDILVEVKQGWRGLEILKGGKQIKLQPGVVLAKANQHLENLGYRIGPDPGSIRSALIGGVVANNASGIGSGNTLNSYKTIAEMEMILPNGLIINTAESKGDDTLRRQAPKIHSGLLALRDKIRASPSLKQKIIGKYKLKNTIGYSLNSFLDYDTPIQILAHLMVGSEGTLGFISSVTFDTVPLKSKKATALLLLPSLVEAASLVPILKRIGSYALEIMDDAALKAVQHIPGLPKIIQGGITEGSAALLVEFQAHESQPLEDLVAAAKSAIEEKHPGLLYNFINDPVKRDKLWKSRRELGPLHAATRQPGTTVLSEDVCFQTKDLARAVMDLQNLFKSYDYSDAVIFGHAGDGNLHFKLSLDFSTEHTVRQYGEFMQDLTDLVINKYDGSLKAEHGTGRNMAPFVKQEWGHEAYQIMEEIKLLLDPAGILNPDVLMSKDPEIHLKHIKPIPLVNPLVDSCIECGLCEPWCPSADLTLTPRQRISVLREVEILKLDSRHAGKSQKILKLFNYEGIDTCATDGLCGLSCPVNIDTGLLMKQMRAKNRGRVSKAVSRALFKNYSSILSALRMSLKLFPAIRYILSNKRIYQSVKRLSVISSGIIPAINVYLSSGHHIKEGNVGAHKLDVIYFPSCLNRALSAPEHAKLPVSEVFTEILTLAGLNYAYPDKVNGLCCGLTFSSKGFAETAVQAAIQTTENLWHSSQNGLLPIIMDTSPCSNHLKNYDKILTGTYLAKWQALTILDVVEYLHDTVLSRVDLKQVEDIIVLHPTCSTRVMGIDKKMESIAKHCAKQVITPIDVGCCAFAGDKGLFIPSLTESATLAEAKEVKNIDANEHYSSSRTCEIGMSVATEKSYQSIIYLVHKALTAN